jgi:hypothetical protein
MKTITRNGTDVSLYLFDDATEVTIDATMTTVGNPVQFYVDDCNTSNATLFTGVTTPEEWTGWKYLYTTAGGWVLNPDWTPPTP